MDSIAYSLTVGFWSGRRRRSRRRRRTGEAGFNIKSNNPNLEGGEKPDFYLALAPWAPWGPYTIGIARFEGSQGSKELLVTL